MAIKNMRKPFICAAVILFAVAMTLCLSFGADASNSETRYLRGDADGNGTVSIEDVTAIQRHLAQLGSMSGADLLASDVGGNGLDVADATAIQRYLAEYEDPYHIGEWVNAEATGPATQSSTVWVNPGDNRLPFV